MRWGARLLVNASKRFSWSASPVRLRNGATPTAMLDSKQGHGIAARSAFGAPKAPPPRCGDDRAGRYRAAAACSVAREFFVWGRGFRRLMGETQFATPRVRIFSKRG